MPKIVKYRNPFNGKMYLCKEACVSDMEKNHTEQIHALDSSAEQILFNARNRYPIEQKFGKSVLSGRPTAWNPKAEKYERFFDDDERELYRKDFVAKMKKTYGKEHLLDDPNRQRGMLLNRSISGVYTFQDGTKKNYTGTYELDFLQYMDTHLSWDPKDIAVPAPQNFEYQGDDGKTHVYIPDAWIESLNLIIEIKSSDNNHYRLRDIDIEKKKDHILETSHYNYIKIFDKEYKELLAKINELKGTADEQDEREFSFNKRQERT